MRAMTVDERVAKGAELLERRYGPGWREKINPRTLRMDNACKCILGQLYGGEAVNLDESGYTYGIRRLRLRVAWAYGFVTEDFAADDAKQDREYKALEKAWRAELKRTA